MNVDPRLLRNYTDLSSDQQREVYRNWSENYDRDLIEDFGYVAPTHAVAALCQRVPDRSTPILDMGCGTGLVGTQLAAEGYLEIDGMDLSPEMLARARALEIYRQLKECDLSEDIELSPIYGAILCIGVFSHKPQQPFDLAKLFHGLLPGGLLIATVNGRGWRELAWPDLLRQSARKNSFTVEKIIDIPYLVKQNINGKLLILRSCIPAPSCGVFPERLKHS